MLLDDFKNDLEHIKTLVNQPDTCYHYRDSLAILADMNPHYRELKTAFTAYQYNPANHTTIGIALARYGTHLLNTAENNKQLPYQQKVAQGTSALVYYRQAVPHLRKTKRKSYLQKAKKNIKMAKKRISYYKRRARKEQKSTQASNIPTAFYTWIIT